MNLNREEMKTNSIQPLVLKTIYGSTTVHKPVLIELLQSPSMQRLKKIDQYGITAYATNLPSFNRYHHSVGVFMLLRKFNCSLHEQIAGLLHDVSHTVFSHVADVVFEQTSDKNSYQDDIHEWFINQTELAALLIKHGIQVKDILHKQHHFKALERPIPYLCADRIEYNLRGGLVENLFTENEIKTTMEALRLENGIWFFTQKAPAKKLAEVALYLQESAYTSPTSCMLYEWAGKLLRHALEINLITSKEIHFSTDIVVLEKLKRSNDTTIQNLMLKIFNYEQFFSIGTPDNFDLNLPVKFRGLDPLVKVGSVLKPLSKLDSSFAQQFATSKKLIARGWYFKYRKLHV